MDLKQFVEETLSQILAGVRQAQAKEGGGAVGGEMDALPVGGKAHGSLLTFGYDRTHIIVEFDVSVSAETTAEGKAGIRVLSVGGVQGGGARTSAESSRVRFAVPVPIPTGDRVDRLKGFEASQELSNTCLTSEFDSSLRLANHTKDRFVQLPLRDGEPQECVLPPALLPRGS